MILGELIMNNGKRRQGKKRSRQGKWRLIILFLVLVALIAGGIAFVLNYQDERDYSALNSQDKKNKQVKVKDGDDAEDVADKLDKAKLIRRSEERRVGTESRCTS